MSRMIAIAVIFFAGGCSAQESPKQRGGYAPVATEAAQEPAGTSQKIGGEIATAQADVKPAIQPVAAVNAIPADRKIIFTGTLIVEVKEFDSSRTAANDLLKTNGAYFTKTDITGDSGKKRSGTFGIKVPVDNFQKLTDALAKLGNPIKNQSDSQDVTEEFIDVGSRVKNLKNEEEVLNKLLKDAAGRLDEVFRIREQIRNNRGEIEKAEGRMLALSKLAAFSTITLTLRETEEYTAPSAPKPIEPPSFENRADATWSASVGALRSAAQWVGLFAIATAPWLPVVGGFACVMWFVRRRNRLARV